MKKLLVLLALTSAVAFPYIVGTSLLTNCGGGGGGITTFAQLGDLDFDLDPANGVTKDGSNLISAMVDQGGSRIFTAPNDKPLWVPADLNGKPTVNNSGGDKFLTNNEAAIVSTVAPYTVIAIFNADDAFLSFFLNLKANTGDGLMAYFSNNAGLDKVQFGSNVFAYGRSQTVPATMFGQWHVMYLTYNGSGNGTLSNFGMVVDGVSASLTASSNPGAGGPLSIIGSANVLGFGYNFQGKWARILKYGKVLSAGEIAQVNALINTTYGL